MRIGISCFGHKPGTAGGTQVYRRELISALASFDRSNQYILLKWEDDNIALDDLPSNFTSVALSCSTKGFLSSRLEQVAVNYFLWNRPNVLSRQADGLALDLIHFPTTVISPVIHAVPVVLTFFDMQQEFHPENFSLSERVRRHLTYRPSARKAGLIISPSSFTAETLVQRYKIPPSKIRRVPVGISDHYKPQTDPRVLGGIRQRYDLPEAFVFYPANTWRHKNHRRLLMALMLLHQQPNLRISLVCTGAASSGETVSQLGRSLGFPESQLFDLGFIPLADMPAVYALARMMVFPSLFEGFGIPVLEAMACGCPVVCANTTALPEVGGEAVRLFDPLNVPAMAETIRQVWEDADLRAAMARQGLRRAEHYRWERIIPAVVEVYRETFQRFSKGNQHAT
jgi:glycosyltransferase involved in cell wall biosynthesis